MAKDPVTSPLRAPFTRFEQPAGQSEVHESVRGHGLQHAVGELVSCPFCMALWISTGLTAGHAVLPRLTRSACVVLSAAAVSDTLQLAYTALKEGVEQS